jgi:kumamolisin
MLKHHYYRIHPRLRGVRLAAPQGFPAGTLSPAQVLTAYGFHQNQYAGALPVKLGIGSLGGGGVQADLDNAVGAWGMARPALSIITAGGAVDDPSDQDSNVENMLDLELVSFTWWWLTGTPADVTIAFGPNTGGGMKAATAALAAAGVEVASWSWGAAASDWGTGERQALAQTLAHHVANGVTFFAASGDDSVDDGLMAPTADYPCADPNVWAVGGTRLTVAASGLRVTEAAWGDGRPGDAGGGGGFDPMVKEPAWQVSALPQGSRGRGVPDTAANADPRSGWQISANGGWTVVGGTSAASPFTAALVAVAKGVAKMLGEGLATPAVYATPSACNDITTGSNGDPADPGWDPATGLGSPRGDAFVQAVVAYVRRDPAALRERAEPPTESRPPPTAKLGFQEVVDLLLRNWPRG